MLTAEELFEEVYELSPFKHPGKVLKLVDAEWKNIEAREISAFDAETCRLAMLAVLEVRPLNQARAALWRVRALSRFAILNWREGVAAIMMGEAFRALAISNDDYEKGRTLDTLHESSSDEALGIIEELAPFAKAPGSKISVGDRSPTPKLVERWLHEKRGFLLLVARRYDESLRAYDDALAAADEARGKVKVAAGRTLVRYSADLDAGGDGGEALAELEALTGQIPDREADLRRDVETNLDVMRSGGRALKAFEIL